MADPTGVKRSPIDESAGRYLQEHEREFRRLTEHAKEVFWISDPERFGTIYVNPAFEEVWGRSREELYENPETLLESVHPEDRERVADAVDNEIERGGFDEIYRIERPDGEVRWIHDRSFPVEDENGEIDEVVGIAVDITERKRIEEQLRHERDLTKRILDTCPVTILVIDAERTITFGNERMNEVMGTDEIAGTPLSEVPWTIYENGEPVPAGQRPFDVIREREEPVYDLQYPARIDGESRWLSINGVPLYEDGEFDGAVFVVKDITGRKRREQALSTVHEATTRMMRAESGEEVCELAVAAATELLPVSRTAVYAFDSETHALRPAARSPAAREVVEVRSSIEDGSPIWEAFVDGETRMVDDGVRAAVIPIGTHGVLVVPTDRTAAFDEEAVSLARLLCDDVEAALNRTEREAALREQGETLQRANEELERLNHVTDIIRSVTQAIVRSDCRAGITSTVCERLAAAEPYRFAWIGEVVDEGIDPEAWSGIPKSYLEKLESSTEADDSAPARTARTGELAVDRALLEDRDEDRRTEALSRNYQSIAAVPLAHRGRSYGVLCVYADRADAFGERERGVLRELGETIGYAIDAMETRNALASDGVTELRLRVRDPEFAPQRLADEGCRIEHRGLVPRSDGASRWFVAVDGTTPERMDELVAGIDRIETSHRVVEGDALYELIVRPPVRDEKPCLFDEAVEHGGRIESMTATAEEVTVTVEMPTESAVRRFVESLRSDYRTVELVGRHDLDRPSMARSERQGAATAELTDRQQEILQVAYFSGYFEDPRETTGAELAEQLGVNRSTFHRTLRAAERASFASLLE
ncbi:PAS domain S-box protein [Halalkalicoccus ordinarius]|uniref:PAS domain S-box protein n=1 Tax=Halalkalicoccus ordinarius TaxID=3116651 RepID=UPI00300E9700